MQLDCSRSRLNVTRPWAPRGASTLNCYFMLTGEDLKDFAVFAFYVQSLFYGRILVWFIEMTVGGSKEIIVDDELNGNSIIIVTS